MQEEPWKHAATSPSNCGKIDPRTIEETTTIGIALQQYFFSRKGSIQNYASYHGAFRTIIIICYKHETTGFLALFLGKLQWNS